MINNHELNIQSNINEAQYMFERIQRFFPIIIREKETSDNRDYLFLFDLLYVMEEFMKIGNASHGKDIPHPNYIVEKLRRAKRILDNCLDYFNQRLEEDKLNIEPIRNNDSFFDEGLLNIIHNQFCTLYKNVIVTYNKETKKIRLSAQKENKNTIRIIDRTVATLTKDGYIKFGMTLPIQSVKAITTIFERQHEMESVINEYSNN